MKLAVTLFFACGALAIPLERRTEGEINCAVDLPSRFRPFMKYTYKYVGRTTTAVVGVTHERTGMKLDAKCFVENIGHCKHILKVENVKLYDTTGINQAFVHSPGEKDLKRALEAEPLRFTMNKGRISEVFPSIYEPVYVTNMKKGILSALQLQFVEELRPTVFEEDDVTGKCLTRYTPEMRYKLMDNMVEETVTRVTKEKNLTDCTSRNSNDTMFNPMFYSNSTALSPLNSTSRCLYDIEDSGHLKKVQCNETHLLKPFSSKQNNRVAGAMTNVTQELILERVDPSGGEGVYISEIRTTTLLYEHSPKQRQTYRRNPAPVRTILEDLVTSVPVSEVRPDVAARFAKLVFALRRVDKDSLRAIFLDYYSCKAKGDFCRTKEERTKYQQYLIDALSQCGTSPCVHEIVRIVKHNKVNHKHARVLLSGLHWIHQPTPEMFQNINELLRLKKNLPHTTYLSLGSMIRKYCEQKPQVCTSEQSPAWQSLLYLKTQLGERCTVTPETVDKMIVVIKALGNAGRLPMEPNELLYCGLNSNYRNVTVAVLQSLRTLPRPVEVQTALVERFRNYFEDPELRVECYLTLMTQPTEDDVIMVTETLDNEVNNQVGSFVRSHLTAINQTVERSQLRIKQIIQGALRKRNKPLRKFSTSAKSYYSQTSMYSERWDIGTSMQHHVIYHPESLMPRSLAFNVTADVLGAAINILETNLRTEDLEVVVKKLFGPEGFFPSNQFQDLFNVPPEEESEDFRTTNRLQRSTDNRVDLKTIDQKVNLRKLSPTAALSMRLFGMDVDMWTLNEIAWLNEDLDIPLFQVIDMLRDLSRGFNKTFTKSALFLEYNHVVPTCLGVPLNISINGTAVMSLHVEGKADLLGFFWKGRKIVVNGKIRPSTSMDISQHMKLDAFHTSSGILTNLTLYTSTEAQGNLTYKNGERLKIHFNITERPQEVLNISRGIFNQMNNILSPIKGIAHRNTTGICTSEMLNTTKILGVDYCATISVPVSWYNTTVPYFPLTGPQNFSIALKRTDPKLTTYKLEAIHERREPTVNHTFITFSTPGATYERKISCNITSVKQKTITWWNMTIGKDSVITTTVGYTYDRATKDLNITLKTNTTANFTGNYYHKTCAETKRVTYGLMWNLTLFNKTVNYSAIVLNSTNHLRLGTNFTVHNCTTKTPVTTFYLNTSIGKSFDSNMTGKFVLNITYQPLNFKWILQGDHNMSRRSTNVTCNMTLPNWSSPLVNHNITVNMTYINRTTEKSIKVKVVSNRSSSVTFHFGCQNLTQKAKQNISVFYFNVTYLNKTTSLNATFRSEPRVKISFLSLTHQNKSLAVNTTWSHHVDVKNVSVNITFLNHSLVLLGVLKNHTTEKGLCLSGTYQNGTVGNYTLLSTCLSWQNTTVRKSLLWNITNENRTVTFNTTWFMRRNLRGVFINCTYRNTTLLNITAIHTNSTTRQTLNFNITLGNYSAELNHTYFTTLPLDSVDRITSINISHRIRNGTLMVVNNSLIFTLYNTTSKKNLILNLTYWNKTYGTQMTYWNRTSTEKIPWHILNVLGYTPNKTLNWTGSFKNTSEMLNVSSLLEYEPKTVLNQSFLLNRKLDHLNISLNLHPNITIKINSSGTFNAKINITTNVTILNNTILWHGFASNKSLMSNLTMWNRTMELVSRTCNRTHSLLLNVSTWHHTNQSAFNGSVTWFLNATERIMHLNFTTLAHPLNATLYMIAFSRNRYHFNSTVYRRNGTEVYNESSLEFREDGKLYNRYNTTTLINSWRMLNNVTFNIPTKLLNMTVNATSGCVNVTTLGNHFRYVLKNITQALKTWNYTTRNVTQNIRNLTIHLLNVTSRSLPSVQSNYTTYYHNHTFNMSRLCEDLRRAVLNISHSNISLENMTEEVIVILRNFTASINYKHLIGNLTSMVTNETLPFINRTIGNVTLELHWILSNWTVFGTNMTRNLTILVNETAVMLGNVSMVNNTINQHLINLIPVWQGMVNEALNETIRFTTFLQNITLSLRNVTHNVTEYIINATHPVLRNLSELIFNRIKNHTNQNSLLGGVLQPGWNVIAVTHNISLVNITMETIHLLTCNTSLELLVPKFHKPANVTTYLHDMIKGKNLEETIEVLVNKTLEMYNVTLRTPEFYLNKTYQLITNYTHLVTMVLNDTINVLNVTSHKTLAEIIYAHLVKEREVTRRLWNMTLELLLTNISVPLNESWANVNLTAHHRNWIHSMPWHRFTVPRWNSTMFKLITFLRNHTWESYTRYYLPRLVNRTANITAELVYNSRMYYTILGQRASNATVLNGTYQIVYLCPLQYRMNHTQLFYDTWYSYNNVTAPVLNVTRNWTQFFLNATWNITAMALNLTSNWTRNVHNVTYTIINTTISFVNGSLVNETLRHYSYLPDHLYIHSMNYSMNFTHHLFNVTQAWINSTITMLINSTEPLLRDLNIVSAILKVKREDVMKAFIPKDNKALFFGRDHFYTFDGRYFRFPGYKTKQCQYLVTRDLRHGNFTVLTNSESITILLKDADVKIYRHGKVTCYSKRQKKEFTELPVQLKHTTLSRNMTHIIVNNTCGFELICDVQHFVCSVAISGFYHNSTAGLLGTNNGEQSDDWLTPAGKNKTDVYSFINSWRVNVAGKEECYWNVPDKNAEVNVCVRDVPGVNRCIELFKENSSPFTECFDKVDPRGFLIACEKDVSSCLTKTPPKVSHCNVTAAYVQTCRRKGVDIEMPTECSQCSARGVTHEYGQSWNVSPKNRDVDVIIISSEGKDMRELTKKLPYLVSDINLYLKKNRKSPRFGLVGFSGRPPLHRPGHVHTLNGKFLGSAAEFHLGITNMDFMPANLPTNISDGFEGIRQATRYPFRPGSTKIFVLFTDSVRVEDSNLNALTVAEMMKEVGARLIVIGDYRFKRTTVGVDPFGNYFVSKRPYIIRRKLTKELPKTDDYFRVITETGGAVFNIKSFERKKVVSSLVVKALSEQVNENARLCKKCFCTRNEVGAGKAMCTTVPSC